MCISNRPVPFMPEVGGVLVLALMLTDFFSSACWELLYWGKITATPS